MIIDLNDVTPFFEWLPTGLLHWLVVVASVAVIATVFSWLVGAVRHGPGAATRFTSKVLRDAAIDLTRMSPRRIWALAWLSIKESIRRRVIVVFAVFILILSFAGWFLDPGSDHPARLYLNFVLTATSYLVLLLALFLSSLSLPKDIKDRTLQTVVTKPVRASEIVLGRMLGFAAVGTVLLLAMGLICYVFVLRGLAHSHELTADDLRPAEAAVAGEAPTFRGHTSRSHNHRHKVLIDAAGKGHVEMEQGHWHDLAVDKDGDKTAYRIGPPEGMLLARIPIYGKLTFRDRKGDPVAKGVNVGDEWQYRSFIEGGSLAAAVWEFDGVTEDAFPKGIPVELNIEVFRTYMGEITKGVPGALKVRNPSRKDNKPVLVRIFESKEFATDVQFIPRELQTPDGEKLDLFKDIVDNGRMELWLECVAPGQYFGAAQGDVYLRARDASFALNFAKGYLGIWLQMLLMIALGVTFSTFLSGPVALIATLGALIGGFFNEFMFKLATGQTFGGGPAESLIRILTQQNVTSEMEPGLRTTVAQTLDAVLEFGLRLMSAVLPNFDRFSFANYVAYGFNVSGDTVLTCTVRAFGFVLPVFVAGYLFLKTREVANN